jgi:geranylgeranyl pyrophosphate synthase
LGGLAAGADDDQLVTLTRYGAAVGLAFQVADDLLDADQDAGEGGPPSYVRMLGLEATRAEARRLALDAMSAARELPAADVLLALARFAVERTV